LYDLENVQVLKGPQGTLFGRNTPAGALLFVPRRPGDKAAGEITLGAGSRNLFETEFGFDMPFSDQFHVRLAGRTAGAQGHQTNVGTVGATFTPAGLQLTGPARTGEKYGGYQERALRLTAVWNLSDSVENTTVVSWDHGTGSARAAVVVAYNPASTGRFYSGGPPFNLPAVLSMSAAFARSQARDIDQVEGDFPMSEYARTAGIFNTTTWKLPGTLSLKNIFGYRSMSYLSSYDIDGSPAPLLESVQPADLHHWSDELQLAGKSFDNKLDWVTGLYHYEESGTELADGRLGGNTFLGISGSARTINGGDVKNKASAAFAQGTLRFTPQWGLTVGARYNKDQKQSTMINQNLGPGAPACVMVGPDNVLLTVANCSRTVSKDFTANTATVSLDYKPTDAVMAYLTARRGYRAGGFNMRAQSAITFEPFKPEFVDDVELGLKADWRAGGWQFRTNVAAFTQKYKDMQRTVSIVNPVVTLPNGTTSGGNVVTSIRNAAQSTINGAELEAEIAPTRDFQVHINYTYLKAKYDNYTAPNTVNPAQIDDLRSTPFAWTPTNAGSVALMYAYPMGGNGTLHFQGSYSFKSQQWTNAFANNSDIPTLYAAGVIDSIIQKSYAIVDFNARWENVMGKPLELTAYVKNATNKRYAVGGLSLYTSLGLNEKVYNDPRVFGVRVGYKF
jgi:iron complex outermembrane receptor protein